MASLFSRRAFRADPFLRIGLLLSFAVAVVLLVIARTPSGEIFGGSSDLLRRPFGTLVIAGLLLVSQAASWGFARLARRVGSTFWMLVAALVWTLALRTVLSGFHDGAWLLTAALAVHAMVRKKPAAAVLWFVASAMISDRAVSLAPLAFAAYWQLVRGADSRRTKILMTAIAAISAAIVVLWLRTLVHHGPHPQDAPHSPLVPFTFYSWFLLGFGLVIAAALAWGTSMLVGACVALCTVLAIYDARPWHGTVCIAPLFAIVLAKRRPLWAQAILALWFAFNLQYVFGFAPFQLLDDVLGVIERRVAEHH